MNRFFRPLALCLASWLLVACGTQVAQPAATGTAWSEDEAQMRGLMSASVAAFNRGDLPGHLAIYDPTVTFMTVDGPRPGIAPIEKAFRETYFPGGQPKQQLRIEQLLARPLGSDAALLTGRFVLSGGGESEQSGWFTTVWLRTPSGWRVVHDHSG
jgi:ketosteroid isomerase-like protein